MIWQKQIVFAPNGHYNERVIINGNEMLPFCQDHCVLPYLITAP